MFDDFEGKRILITGAAGGFGQILSQRLAAFGARLLLSDLDTAKLDAAVQNLQSEVHTKTVDVSDEAQVKDLCVFAKDRLGGLDIAVNNAGVVSKMKSLLDTTEDDLDRTYAVNAKGVFFCMKHQIPLMLDQGHGAILNVASVAGLNGAPKLSAYAASKHAVVGLTRTAAVEFARKGIRINAVCPFFSPTPMISDVKAAGLTDMLASGSPMKRLGDPTEVVSAMLSIIHPANTYLTGQAIAVDGGVSAI